MSKKEKPAQSKSPSPKHKSRVSLVINQARESLKLLETLEKETLAKARTFVRNPIPANRKRLTNEKILSSLRSLGVATRSEVQVLDQRLQNIEAELATLNTMLAQTGAKRPKTTRPQATPEAFPNT